MGVASINTVASGGGLALGLVKQLKDTGINGSWSKSETNDSMTDHIYRDRTYIFLQMERVVTVTKTGMCCFSTRTSHTIFKTHYLYMEPENKAAEDRLMKLQENQASDALNYINSL